MDDDHGTHEIHWLESLKKEILARGQDTLTLSTGKTPSGSIHIGILREITSCDCLKRSLVQEGKQVRFLLFFDSLDAAKKFPSYVPASFSVHAGKPFSDIPCPVAGCGCESYARHWGNELVSTFDEFGIAVDEIVWADELYQTPGMKAQLRKAMDATERIRAIVARNILPTIDEGARDAYLEQLRSWYPAMAICSRCGTTQYNDKAVGRILANRIVEYDPDAAEIVYECPNPACKNAERVAIDDARLKLNWRVDWPAKWDLYKTSCEPAGKDHATKGGSYDTGLEISQEVFGYAGPTKLAYEWLRLGDQDMSTSGGIVFNPREYLRIGALPEAFRHVIVKTKPMTHVSFRVENLPQMFDDYERFEKIRFGFEEAPAEEVEQVTYMYPFTQARIIPAAIPARVPFRYAAVMAQLRGLLDPAVVREKCQEMARRATPGDGEKKVSPGKIDAFLDKVAYWIDTYAPPQYKFSVQATVPAEVKASLSASDKDALRRLGEVVASGKCTDEQELQNAIFAIAKDELHVQPTKVFQAIYKVFLGTKSGPRLGPFLLALDRKFVVDRLAGAVNG